MTYGFNAIKLFKRLTPYFWRGNIFIDWIQVITRPFQYLSGQLTTFSDQITYDLQFSASVIYFEHVLNDAFDNINRLIYIENVFLPPVYIYNDVEAQPAVYVRNDSEGASPFYLNQQAEFASATQYIIHLPVALASDEDAIIALVEVYNLAGMVYELAFDIV